jgi:hypothetical protein
MNRFFVARFLLLFALGAVFTASAIASPKPDWRKAAKLGANETSIIKKLGEPKCRTHHTNAGYSLTALTYQTEEGKLTFAFYDNKLTCVFQNGARVVGKN